MNSEIRTPFTFTRRPLPLRPDLRPIWKVSLIALMLARSSYGRKSSVSRLHILNWALKSTRHQELLNERLAGTPQFSLMQIRFEPAFARAIDLAAAQHIVTWVAGDRLLLGLEGKELSEVIIKDASSFSAEKAFLQSAGKRLTEQVARGILNGGSR